MNTFTFKQTVKIKIKQEKYFIQKILNVNLLKKQL